MHGRWNHRWKRLLPVELLEASGEQLAVASPKLMAVAHLESDFQYHPSRVLTAEQRQQYEYWLCQGCRPHDLWFFKVLHVQALPLPSPLHLWCRKLRNAKTFNMLDGEEAGRQVCEGLRGADGSLPAWLPNPRQLSCCLLVPAAFLYLVTACRWISLSVPSPFSNGEFRMPRWFLRALHPQVQETFARTAQWPHPHHWSCKEMFEYSGCQDLADDLRRVICAGQQPMTAENYSRMSTWICRLQNTVDETSFHFAGLSSQQRGKRTGEDIIRFAQLADMLKSARHMRDVIVQASTLCLPPALARFVQEGVGSKVADLVRPPSASESRLVIDAGIMLWRRLRNLLALRSASADPECGCVHFFTWDSSPQYHRDYVMAILTQIQKSDLPEMLRCFRDLCVHWEGATADDLNDQERIEVEGLLMDTIAGCIQSHAAPAVQVGFGVSSFAHKIAAFSHAVRLEHCSHESFALWCQRVVGHMSDYGVEHNLTQVGTFPVDRVCPHFADSDNLSIEMMLDRCQMVAGNNGPDVVAVPAVALPPPAAPDAPGADADADIFEDPDPVPGLPPAPLPDVFEDAPAAPQVDLGAALDSPPLHHIIDNATCGLRDVMANYKGMAYRLQNVCKLLRRPDLRLKLLSRCFSCPIGRQFHSLIAAFKGHVYAGRWGMLSFSVPEVLALERILRWGWNLARFANAIRLAPADGHQAGEQHEDAQLRLGHTIVVASADEGIRDPMFWAWLHMVEELAKCLRRCSKYADSCSCHAQVWENPDATPPELKKTMGLLPHAGLPRSGNLLR